MDRRAFAIVSILLTSQLAYAGGFLAARFGGEQGHPTTDDATAIYFNPAGLSLMQGTRLHLNGVIGYRLASYDRPAGAIDNLGTGTPTDAVAANSGHASLANPLTLPFVALVTDFGVKNLAAGVAFYVPFGGTASWNKNEAFRGSLAYPGAVDGPQRWASLDGEIRSYYVTAAVAYRIERARLSLGAAVNLVYNTITTLRARTANATDDLVAPSGLPLEGRSLLDASNLTASLGVGVVWQPTPRWWLGVSYQSQPSFGRETLTGTLRNRLGAGAVSEQPIELKQALPDVLRVGVRVRPRPSFELRLSGDYQRWSVFDRQCILDANTADRNCALNPDGSLAPGGSGVILNLPRDWSDGWALRFGGSWFVRPHIELFASFGYDSNVVPDATLDATFMDADKLVPTLGGRFLLARNRLLLAVQYSQVVYLPREVPVAARNEMGARIAAAPPSRSPDNGGRYEQNVGLFSLALEYRFQ